MHRNREVGKAVPVHIALDQMMVAALDGDQLAGPMREGEFEDERLVLAAGNRVDRPKVDAVALGEPEVPDRVGRVRSRIAERLEDEGVVAGTAPEVVRAAAADEGVRAGTARKLVDRGVARRGCRCRTRRSGSPSRSVCPCRRRRGLSLGDAEVHRHGRRQALVRRGVVAGAAVEDVVPEPANQ